MKTVVYKYKKGGSDYHKYITNDTNEQIRKDIKSNNAYLVKILKENEILEIKGLCYPASMSNEKYSWNLVQYVQDCI